MPDSQVKVDNWSMGEHRFPQSAQNPLYKINSFVYPAAFTPGSLGSGTQRGLWLLWPQWSLSKGWSLKERYRFSVRVDGNKTTDRETRLACGAEYILQLGPRKFARVQVSPA